MIDIAKLTSNFFKGKQVFIGFQYHSDAIFLATNSTLAKILNRLDLPFLIDTIITVVREIILNAAKANAKRVLFDRMGLNINDPKDYAKGMATFKEIISNFDKMKDEIVSSSFRITIKMQKTESGFSIDITNNAQITPEEKKRIDFRIETANHFRNFSEAYEIVYDASEGAGLGIMLVVLLLYNAGIRDDAFSISYDNNSVTTHIFIPNVLRNAEIKSDVRNRIIENIEALPTFPEHIIEIQRMCRNPRVSIENVSSKITMDPSLTADVLKIANSAGFMPGRRIETVNDAILIIGFKNLGDLVSIAAAQKIIQKKYNKFEAIWNHCVKTAFYARMIAEKYGHQKSIEHAFLGGLLHDIGKIILLSLNEKLSRTISEIVEKKNIRSSTMIEEIALGISHSQIGAMIADKWNFPEYLINVIRHHHSPLAADREDSTIVSIVYLANMICNVEKQKATFQYLESEILKKFAIKTEKDFQNFHRSLEMRYREFNSTM